MWNDMENMEEKWKDLKIQKKIVKRYEKYGKYERKVNFFPYYSVKPPHTGICPLRQCYPHINSYAPNCSVKPPHKELFPLL
jgi:hypothetical protein